MTAVQVSLLGQKFEKGDAAVSVDGGLGYGCKRSCWVALTGIETGKLIVRRHCWTLRRS